jgi:hypothetical protein
VIEDLMAWIFPFQFLECILVCSNPSGLSIALLGKGVLVIEEPDDLLWGVWVDFFSLDF